MIYPRRFIQTPIQRLIWSVFLRSKCHISCIQFAPGIEIFDKCGFIGTAVSSQLAVVAECQAIRQALNIVFGKLFFIVA